MRTYCYRMLSTSERYSEAAAVLRGPGDCAIVERQGVQRQLVICCPDGCGETLSINLDPRAGPAWRLYKRDDEWTLFPSIDRPTGCQSHFILWRGRIFWTDEDHERDESHKEVIRNLRGKVLAALENRKQVHFVDLAESLKEIPWDVLAACRRLARRGEIEEGKGLQRGIFWVPEVEIS
jgi:Family of unknown function (DUF6527)